MNNRQRKTLEAVFATPARMNVRWGEVESLLRALKADVTEREGSRVGVALNGVRMVLHEPHPRPELGRRTLRDIRDFLKAAGIEP